MFHIQENINCDDINMIDEKIKNLFISTINGKDKIEQQIRGLDIIIKNETNYLKRKELIDKKNKLIKQMSIDDNHFDEYITISYNIISKIKKELSKPIEIDFFGNKKDDNKNNNEDNLINEFLSIAKNFINININAKKKDETKDICECGSINFEQTDNYIVCIECGLEQTYFSNMTNFKDIDRVNMYQRYKYNRKVYFRETVKAYEGLQNKTINKNVYNDLDEWFKKNDLIIDTNETYFINDTRIVKKYSKLKKQHFYIALSDTGHTNFSKDVNLLYFQYTGILCPTLEHIRDDIYNDFEKIMGLYDDVFMKVNEDNKYEDNLDFLKNCQYILYQLLKRRNIAVKKEDFGLKSNDSLREYDEIYKKICERLEWNFISIL